MSLATTGVPKYVPFRTARNVHVGPWKKKEKKLQEKIRKTVLEIKKGVH